MHTKLIEVITQYVTLSDQEKVLCTRYLEPISCPKNSVIEEEGKVPMYLYFVVSGFVRLFHYNDKGDEVTTHINCPPGFITSYTHFANQTRAEENVECVTACELLRVSKASLDLLIEQSSAFKDFSIHVFQQSLSYNEKRARELATLTAEQRYLRLMDEYPEVLHHVPMQYIASFFWE